MQNTTGLGFEIIVNGSPLREYSKDGKTYVAAPMNTDFQIRYLTPMIRGHRHDYKRFLGVTSVDGLCVMTGKDATPSSGGYVLTPAKSLTDNDIPGFRLSDKEVANFHFGDRQDSYAARIGKGKNVGVIGVIFYSEFDPAPRPQFLGGGHLESLGGGQMRGGGHTFGGGGMKGGGHDMGTEFGRRNEHRVSSTSFDRDREVARFVMEYASTDSLVKAGIIVLSSSPLGEVSAFGETGCQPPPGWTGR